MQEHYPTPVTRTLPVPIVEAVIDRLLEEAASLVIATIDAYDEPLRSGHFEDFRDRAEAGMRRAALRT